MCEDTKYSGQSDLAVMELAHSIDFTAMNHVKPACNYALQAIRRKPEKDVS